MAGTGQRAGMSEIVAQECQTDKIITEAGLRGIKVIGYNEQILALKQDLEELRAILRRNDIKQPKAVEDLEGKIHAMEQQARAWISSVDFTLAGDYAITILIEEVK